MTHALKNLRPEPVWKTSEAPVAYADAVLYMEETVRLIRERAAPEEIWLLEHPPLYTAGTSAQEKDLLNPAFPVIATGRGGQYTYHGPGQRVAYVMLDLQQRGADLRRYICDLEEWIIKSLDDVGIKGERRAGRVGIWVKDGSTEAKIAAIGVRVRKWVTYHGVAINVHPDLNHFNGIVPCGIRKYGVTSLEKMGIEADMKDMDAALFKNWSSIFG